MCSPTMQNPTQCSPMEREEQNMHEPVESRVRVRVQSGGPEGWQEVAVASHERPVQAGLRALRKRPPLVGDGWYVIEQKS